jgi:hypothetical protein
MISGNALNHQEVESAIILMLCPISWKYSATVIPDGKRYNMTVNIIIADASFRRQEKDVVNLHV